MAASTLLVYDSSLGIGEHPAMSIAAYSR